MQIFLKEYCLPLRYRFTITHESRIHQPTLIVALSDGNITGYGEAAEVSYYKVTLKDLSQALKNVRHLLADYSFTSPWQLWTDLQPYLQEHPFAQCALDQAAWDYYGRKMGVPLYQLLGLNPANAPISNYTIGIDSVEVMLAKMKEMPWPIYKIKLGMGNDLEIIRALRQHTEAVFRVDANCGWTAEQTIEYAQELKQLGVEFIEQPLKADDWEGMKEVFTYSKLPIIADESCILETDVARCKEYFHGINIKLTKCGGITPALRMINQARQYGMKVMVGCMVESSVGISAIAHLAPLLDYVDMDGALLLSQDIATGVQVTPQGAIYPSRNGTGVEMKDGFPHKSLTQFADISLTG
ncbi:MAG: dipeptide epimerase [Cytophagales bacterium]|nr:dipeptide epimerase [Bernardetiaceae bacterium]MDW8209855.1 dipeptide epimerase [Cytophagales bacterium]